MPGDFCRFRNDRDCRSAYFLDAHLVIVWVSYGVEVTMCILIKLVYPLRSGFGDFRAGFRD